MNARTKHTVKSNRSEKDHSGESAIRDLESGKRKVKFELFGDEMIEKTVKLSGNSGRVYLPPMWIGRNVKIICG